MGGRRGKDSRSKGKKKQTTVVKCPSCRLILSMPTSAQQYIRCPCEAVLVNPKSTGKDTSRLTSDNSRVDCEKCHVVFTVLNRRHHCRNCGSLVCGTCSSRKWPASMVPDEFNYKNERFVRVCNVCHLSMEQFRNACLQGDTPLCERILCSSPVPCKYPFSVFPHSLYAVHLAASSGSVPLVRWLLQIGADPTVKDDRGWTMMRFAAQKSHLELMSYLIAEGLGNVQEVPDVATLHKCLDVALQSNLNTIPVQQQSFNLGSSAYTAKDSSYPDKSESQAWMAKCAVPSSATEEEEQLQIALAASMASCDTAQPPPIVVAQQVSETSSVVRKECIVCFEERKSETVFVPCGHSCCCSSCASKFKGDSCPVCRETINQLVTPYSIT